MKRILLVKPILQGIIAAYKKYYDYGRKKTNLSMSCAHVR